MSQENNKAYSVHSKTVLALKSEDPERHYWQGGCTQSLFPAPHLVKELHITSLMLINLLSYSSCHDMWQVTQRTRDMQSDDTCHSVIASFPPSVYMFRGCREHIRELQTLLETGLLLCTIMHCAPPHSCSSAL